MAKIKIKGYSDMVNVGQDKATAIRDMWMDKSVDNSQKITIGNIALTKGQIVAVFLDDEQKPQDDKFKQGVDEYHRLRDALLQLSPRERAKKMAWGHFSLFYWGVFKTKPRESLKQQVLDTATKFYQENPKWAKPNMKLWYDMLKLDKDFMMNGSVLRVLEICELREQKEIEDTDKYLENKKIQKESQEKAVSTLNDGINVEDLF